jgi:hypothetical protein
MKKILIALFLLSLCKVTHAQSIKIPSDYEVGYFFGFQGHKFIVASELEMGVGLEGFYQTTAIHPGLAEDKFYLGIRYRWRGFKMPKWEGTIGAGAFTSNIIQNFPVYPLKVGVRGTMRYELAKNLYLGPHVFLTSSNENSDVGLGLVYKLY